MRCYRAVLLEFDNWEIEKWHDAEPSLFHFICDLEAIVGHARRYFKDGWVKGTPQNRYFVKLSDYQQQLGIANASSISNQRLVSARTFENNSSNAYHFSKRGVQIFGSLEARPLPQASSSRRPWTPSHLFRVCDLMILSRIKDRLTEKKEKAILRILASAMDQTLGEVKVQIALKNAKTEPEN
ncbi:hypothetical protein CQW23_03807 [Capsicum baccatum]|uniref:Uncharacterized protein n=1 Tax=Capsicum baccatum TaxID=33114 RepID=A0A2G2XDA0_CAPBA|nr:hypothetical protein CQW23_03807 [Capsicum baccatum]